MPPTDVPPQPVADVAAPRSPEAPAVERRRYRRFWVGLNVRIYWQDEQGRQREAPALLRDVSAGGFGIELQDRLEVGTLITVRTMVKSPRCEVRHVRANEKRVLIGVKVLPSEDGSRHEESLEKLAAALAASRRTRRGD
jgi:c-di-GMP-binding flagellar brake protein YcgR